MTARSRAWLSCWSLRSSIARALASVAPTFRVGVRGHLAIAFAIAAIASGLTAWRLAPILPDGDEPHYLVITQSLLFDGDLQIENNHRQGDYLVYADRDLRPDYLKRGQNGQIYSVHPPGVSALVLPAFAAGGYPGVVGFLVLLFGVASALTWRAAYQLTGDATSAWVGWAGVVLSAPAFFHSFTVYPDGPAALVVIGVVSFLITTGPVTRARWQWLLAGAAIATLPWLHTRLALVAVVLLAVLAFRIVVPGSTVGRAFRPGASAGLEPRPTYQSAPLKGRPTYDQSAPLKRPRRSIGAPEGTPYYELVALFAVPAISTVLWLTFFYLIYGTLDPRAPYGGRDGQSLAGIPRGLTGLLVDQQFGVLPTAPVYGIALAGLATLWRTHRRLAVELAAIAIPYILVVSANEMWWAGLSAPARFLVPVLLPMALPLAAWWQRHDSRVPRAFTLVALGASLAITATLAWTGRGAILYNGRDGFALWLDLLAPAVSLARAEPTVFRGALAATWAQAAIWCAAAAACWWVLSRIDTDAGRPDSLRRLRRSAEASARRRPALQPQRPSGQSSSLVRRVDPHDRRGDVCRARGRRPARVDAQHGTGDRGWLERASAAGRGLRAAPAVSGRRSGATARRPRRVAAAAGARSRALDRPRRRARALPAGAERHQRVDWHADCRPRTP